MPTLSPCSFSHNPWADSLSLEETLESLLAKAEGTYPGTQNQREGIVVRPLVDVPSQVLGSRLSFKVISNRYLLDERD